MPRKEAGGCQSNALHAPPTERNVLARVCHICSDLRGDSGLERPGSNPGVPAGKTQDSPECRGAKLLGFRSTGHPVSASGEIETLPSGSLRVRVYAGLDPITGKRNYLTEVIAPGSAAAKDGERARTKLLGNHDHCTGRASAGLAARLADIGVVVPWF